MNTTAHPTPPQMPQDAPLGCIVFDNLSLVPMIWRQEVRDLLVQAALAGGASPDVADAQAAAALRFRVFNPTLVARADGYSMCYRVVADNTDLRRMATCQLTHDLKVIESTLTPLSDLIDFARADELNHRAKVWHADPRYLRLGGQLHVIWNDGANRPRNHQFIVAMDELGLRPSGQAREISREFKRDPIEKNWMLFESDGGVWATYSIQPHVVLSVDFDQADRIPARTAHVDHWSNGYQSRYGHLRGSAQPLDRGDTFLAIAHSSYKTDAGRRYCAAFYRFQAQSPFQLLAASAEPLPLPNPRGSSFEMEKLNKAVAEVIYPCGFVIQGADVVVSYGINDEACAVVRMPLSTVEANLAPVQRSVGLADQVPALPESWPRPTPLPVLPEPTPPVPLFWWDAKGKKLDGGDDSRLFTTGNFGDIASKEIVEQVGKLLTRLPRPGERKLLAIGSVLHTARNGDIIWGTGAKGSKLALAPGVTELSVHAVRGPLTAEMLRRNGIDISGIQAFFDPGCLIPVLYRAQIDEARRRGGAHPGGTKIIPHYRDDREWRALHPHHAKDFISVDDSPAGLIAGMVGADRVISSSLHGLIFAEALGIPAVWLAPDGKEDQMKYYDYYYGSGRSNVKVYQNLADALRAEPMPLPKFDFAEYLKTFPARQVAALALQSYGLDLGFPVEMGMASPGVRDSAAQFAGFDRADRVGTWMTGRTGHLTTRLRGTSADVRYRVELMMHPFNPKELPAPQEIALRANGGPYSVVRWTGASKEAMAVELEVAGGEGTTPVHLEFVSGSAVAPRDLGLSPIAQPLAVCLTSLGAYRAG